MDSPLKFIPHLMGAGMTKRGAFAKPDTTLMETALAQCGVGGEGEYKQGVLSAYEVGQGLHRTARIFEGQKKTSTL